MYTPTFSIHGWLSSTPFYADDDRGAVMDDDDPASGAAAEPPLQMTAPRTALLRSLLQLPLLGTPLTGRHFTPRARLTRSAKQSCPQAPLTCLRA